MSSELHYTVVTDIGSAELSLLQEYLVWEWINGQGIDYKPRSKLKNTVCTEGLYTNGSGAQTKSIWDKML